MFFFLKKKYGGLRPCINYYGLNTIPTVQYPYPLPLLSTLKQFREARYFPKLDLHSAFNPIDENCLPHYQGALWVLGNAIHTTSSVSWVINPKISIVEDNLTSLSTESAGVPRHTKY